MVGKNQTVEAFLHLCLQFITNSRFVVLLYILHGSANGLIHICTAHHTVSCTVLRLLVVTSAQKAKIFELICL